MKDQSIQVTDAALHYLKKQLEKEQAKHIRLAVKEVGCSGMAYVIDYVDDTGQDDHVFSYDTFDIYIAAEHYPYLKGMEVDFVKRGVNAMIEFNNPNATGTCGCGESFTIDEDKNAS